MTPLSLNLKQTGFSQGAILYDATRVMLPTASMFDPEMPQWQAQSVTQGGRQAAWFVSGEFGHAVLRHYRRGGLMARISADRYIWCGSARTRSFAELRVLEHLYTQGLAVPRPVAAIYWRSALGYRAAILIERIDNVKTLTEIVRQADVTDTDQGLIQAVAVAIHAMHEAQVWHADLNAYNILLDGQGSAWLIDFDKARCGPVATQKRISNLKRLRRSLIKVAQNRGEMWWKHINRAYHGL